MHLVLISVHFHYKSIPKSLFYVKLATALLSQEFLMAKILHDLSTQSLCSIM